MKQVGHSNTISRLIAIHLIISHCNQACSDSQLLVEHLEAIVDKPPAEENNIMKKL
jgi:hypothetical protein